MSMIDSLRVEARTRLDRLAVGRRWKTSTSLIDVLLSDALHIGDVTISMRCT